MKNDFFQVRITDSEKAEIAELVTQMPEPDLTVSQFVRDAVREKAKREKRKLPRLTESAETA